MSSRKPGSLSIAVVSVLAALLVASTASADRRKQQLGKALFSDINLSLNRNQSCESCHSLTPVEIPTEVAPNRFKILEQPALATVDPSNVRNGTAVSDGSVDRAFGGLNAPSMAYAAFSPDFFWDDEEELFFGGQFWNGRAKDLVEQAKGPFVNPVEMAMPSEWAVIERLRENRRYNRAFRAIFGINLRGLSEGDPGVSAAYQAMAEAIAAFEATSRFSRFDSKFDFEGAGITGYNESEQRGADLFDDRAQCGLCHTTEGIDGDGTPSLLTDFSYDNLGTPPNPQLPAPSTDPGLLANPNLLSARGEPTAPDDVEGRHKVMSLRNIELTSPYMHNGVVVTLKEVVDFYDAGGGDDPLKDPRLRPLGLVPSEKADLLAFLESLSGESFDTQAYVWRADDYGYALIEDWRGKTN